MREWLAACALLGAGAAGAAWFTGFADPVQPVTLHPLAWDAGRWLSRPWTLWTAAWVHTSTGHEIANVLALGALATAGAALGAGRAAAVALLTAWPLGTLALTAWPQVSGYAGLGGPLHAAAAVLGAHLAHRGATKGIAPFIFAGLALKLISEHAWNQPVAFDPAWGLNVVVAAHLTGALFGGLAGVLAVRLSPAESRS